jgi:hypothetical protein
VSYDEDSHLAAFFCAIAEVSARGPELRLKERRRGAEAFARLVGWQVPSLKVWRWPPPLDAMVGSGSHLRLGRLDCLVDHAETFWAGQTRQPVMVSHPYHLPHDDAVPGLERTLIEAGLAASILSLPSWYYPGRSHAVVIARANVAIRPGLVVRRLGSEGKL